MIARTVIVFSLVACVGSHVALQAPPPDLPPDGRVQMFMDLRPAKQSFVTSNGQLTDTTLILANKTEVTFPEDLEPVVVAKGETVRAARRSIAARGKKRAWFIAMFGAIAFDVFLVGGFQSSPPFHLSEWVAWPVALAAVGIPALISRHYLHVELDERKQAFRHYTRDLGDRLDVCAHQLEVVPCDPPPPSAAPSSRTAMGMRSR